MAKLTRAEIREGLTQIPIDVLLVGNNKNVQLTSKEEKFVKGLVEGKPKAQSYREAYNTKSTKQRQASDASKLAKKPKIAQRVGEEMLRKRFRELNSLDQMRTQIIENLYIESIDLQNPPSVRVTALATLGKVSEINLFDERKESKVLKHSKDIKLELLDSLKDIIDVQLNDPIDTSASDLLNEINGLGDSEADSGFAAPTTPVQAQIDRDTVPQDIHSIPHNQSLEIKNNIILENEEPVKNQWVERK
tara:strand:+ start:3286 stop:4029 length:744 start_codon:yes stop_codon:yes gene_type:complete